MTEQTQEIIAEDLLTHYSLEEAKTFLNNLSEEQRESILCKIWTLYHYKFSLVREVWLWHLKKLN